MAKQKPGTVAPLGGERSPGSGNEGDFVTVAKVIKTQGRIGEVAAVLLTDFPQRFSQPGPYYSLDKENRRREIQVPLEQRIELEEGSIYLSDLTGCVVFDNGHEVGRIQDVQFGSGEAPLLIVKSGSNKEYMIPFAAEFLEELDIPHQRVAMKLPAGMLELDAPLNNDEKERQKNKD